MPATLIDGAAVAAEVRAQVATAAADLLARTGVRPGLATVLVGNDTASEVYIGMKRRLSADVGIADLHRHLPASASAGDVTALIGELATDPAVHGILLQLPVPAGLDGRALTELIPPVKDVDGLTTLSTGALAQGTPGLRPCTPLGVIELIDRTGVPLAGAEAVVVGRSDLVGRPVAQLLVARDVTVTVAHSRTRELDRVTRRADVLVVAAGVPDLIGPGAVKPGAVVIDVGMNHVTGPGPSLVGDVAFDAVREVAGYLTPVPGGVGPMTIAMLLRNTVAAACQQLGVDLLRAAP